MNPGSKEARPPYVSFATRAVEDRAESEKQGMAVMKDVDYAFITPHGSKDRMERVVSEWFVTLKDAVAQERFPQAWLDAYKQAYAAWKAGLEIPLNGTPIRNWPMLTPAQLENLQAQGIKTIEDLAQGNEELIMRLGMGGRNLRDKAKTWLETAGSEVGKATERITSLEAANRQLAETNAQMAEALEALKRDLKELREERSAQPA